MKEPTHDAGARRRGRIGPAARAATLGMGAILTACLSDVTAPERSAEPRAVVSVGSGHGTGPEHFLRPAADAPELRTRDTTFVATRGQHLRVELHYAEGQGRASGRRFLRFELDAESLARYPEDHPTRAGEAFQPGDTVHISISVEEDRLGAKFRPSGLQFDPGAPVELEMAYVASDGDLDGDGDVDSDDDLEEEIGIWKQEADGGPWELVGWLKDLDSDEIKAWLTSFTRYAVAI